LFESTELYQWVILPFLIFASRVADVSLGTIRVISISRGMKYFAPLIGFFEILVWLLAIGQIMQNLSNPVCYIAYALGFSTGNYMGIMIAEKLAFGKVLIRIITQQDSKKLIKAMSGSGYGITTIDGQGAYGPVKIIYSVVPRKKQANIFELVQTHNPKAFYTSEEVGISSDGFFPMHQSKFSFRFKSARKGK
jgi:uncharacterized protein YebE (UPF0316 family)